MNVVAQLLYLYNKNSSKDISLYINSPGGSVTSGMAIFDTMNFIKCDVTTICVGLAASMGAFLLASGTKGKRYALPNSEIMIHQPLGGAKGQATDIKIQAELILRTRDRLNAILAQNTGKTIEQVAIDTERDNWLTAEDALEFILAGATAVSVGAMNFVNPYTTIEVIEGIEKYMETYGVKDIKDLIMRRAAVRWSSENRDELRIR